MHKVINGFSLKFWELVDMDYRNDGIFATVLDSFFASALRLKLGSQQLK